MRLDFQKPLGPMKVSEDSQEKVHATAVAIDGKGILIIGSSGSGKSDLAIHLIDRGAILISDDQVIVSRKQGKVTLNPPANIAGKIELYSLGIHEVEYASDLPLVMVVRLVDKSDRYPLDRQTYQILDFHLPLITLDSYRSTAPIKVEMALKQIVDMSG